MGLKFCNEAIIALQQIWPRNESEQRFSMSPLQVFKDILMNNLFLTNVLQIHV